MRFSMPSRENAVSVITRGTTTWRWLKRHEVIKKELTIQSPDSGKIREENNERGDKYKCNCRGENNMTIIIRKL